jgi:hypothetical protein
VSLIGVMIVLPAALMWAEQHGAFRNRNGVHPAEPGASARRDLLALRRTQADTS